MIKNLIFDFGDIFINLDKPAPVNAFLTLGINTPLEEVSTINDAYEMGQIDTNTFLYHYKKWLPKATEIEIIEAWNTILKDFPIKRLEFLKNLKQEGKFKLFLLSNTNDLHIEWVAENIPFYEEFKACFDVFYLSQQIGFRKPNTDIFEFVLSENKLNPEECLFIDDLEENTKAATSLGIHTWNLIPKQDDVTELFTKNAPLF